MFRENTMKCKVQGFLSCTPSTDERLKSKERIVKVEMQASMVGPHSTLRDPLPGLGQRRHGGTALLPPNSSGGPGSAAPPCQPREMGSRSWEDTEMGSQRM